MSDLNLTIHYVVFGLLPYVVMAILVLGSIARFVLAPYSWKSHSSEILSKGASLTWGSNLFHIGVVCLFFGHIFGLFTPTQWLDAAGLTPRYHQLLEIYAGGASAALAILGLVLLFLRRTFNVRVRTASRKSDFVVLLILIVVVSLGIACVVNSAEYDRSGATLILFGEWVRGLFTFDMNAWQKLLIVPAWQKWHIFFGLMVFLIVPFTRLIHVWSGYLTPIYLLKPHQIMRTNGKPMK